MTKLTPFNVARYAKQAGWEQSKIAWIVAVTFGESGWDTEAIGPDGHDFGLAQMRDIHRDQFPDFFPPSNRWKDPVANLAAARVLYESQGPGAWVANGGKEMQSAQGQATIAAAQVQTYDPSIGPITVQGQSVLDANLQSLKFGAAYAAHLLGIPVSANANVDANGNIDTTVSTPLDWVNANIGSALWVGGGAILVLLGVLLLAKSEIESGDVGKVL